MKPTIAFLTPIILVFIIILTLILTDNSKPTYTLPTYTQEPCLFENIGCEIIRIQTESNNLKAFINSLPTYKSCSISS